MCEGLQHWNSNVDFVAHVLDCILLLSLITAQSDQFVHSSWFPLSLGCHWTVIIPVREQTEDEYKTLQTPLPSPMASFCFVVWNWMGYGLIWNFLERLLWLLGLLL
jgi:hypothetical protein